MREYREDTRKNPFVPMFQMSSEIRKQTIQQKKDEAEVKRKQKEADEKLMSTAREPVPI